MARQTAAAMEETKNTIISVAMNLFLSQGIANTTMKEVADGAGIALRTLYRYFEDKDQLASSIAVIQRELLEDSRHARCQVTGTGYERLSNHLAFLLHYQCLLSTLRISRFLAEYTYYSSEFSHVKRNSKRIREITTEYEQLITDFLLTGQEDGTICTQIDAHNSAPMFVMLYIQIVHKMAFHYIDDGQNDTPDTTTLKTFFDHYLRSVKA